MGEFKFRVTCPFNKQHSHKEATVTCLLLWCQISRLRDENQLGTQMGKVQPAVAQNNPNRKRRIRRDTSATNLGLPLCPNTESKTLRKTEWGGPSVSLHITGHGRGRGHDEAALDWLTMTMTSWRDGPLPRQSSRPHGNLVTSSGNDRALMQPSNYDRIMTGWSLGDLEQAAPCGTTCSAART